MRLIPQFPSWWGQSQVIGAEDWTVDLAGTAVAHPRVLGRSRDGEEARGARGGSGERFPRMGRGVGHMWTARTGRGGFIREGWNI